ncbi:hypothetical protein [Clostridium thermarum]|nr:hypothetical protein [Clostridium thermarum]
MIFDIMHISSSLIEKQAVDEILKCNDIALRFVLTLSPEEAKILVET